MPKYSNAGIVDENIKPAKLGVDEPEQLGDIFMVSNIGNFPLDFTGSFRSQLSDSAIDAVLAPAADCHRRAFQQQHFAIALPIPRVPPVTRHTWSFMSMELSGFMETSIDRMG